MSSAPEWTQWWQDDLPCQFSSAQALENAAYLTQLLGETFFHGAQHPVSELKHPILQRWRTRGAGAFLELNALAADLRVVDAADGIELVLHDLRDSDRCLSSWHAIHSAALLSRPSGSSVQRFFPQTDESLPDFSLCTEGSIVACEAKLLAKSGSEEAFEAYASDLARQVLGEVVASEELHPVLVIVLKDVGRLPRRPDVITALKVVRNSFVGEALEYRSAAFFFVESSTHHAIGSAVQRSCYILCPKSEKEDLRVQRPGKKASKQLASPASAEHPGLLLLGVTRLQDPKYVADLFRKRFAAGQYSGISGVMLLQSGTQIGSPVRAPVDLISVIRNGRASRAVPNFQFKTVGLLDHLASDAHDNSIPAYRFQVHEARVGEGALRLNMPDVRDLRPEML